MFHGAGVLPAHLVVGDPAVLRGGLAVLGEFGLVVDGAGGVVVFDPADVPQMPHVHVQPVHSEAGGDDAVQLVGVALGVEQAVAQGGGVKYACLAACDDNDGFAVNSAPALGARAAWAAVGGGCSGVHNEMWRWR